MKTKILDFISLLVALIATILATADTQETINGISPVLAAKWPVIMGSALIISRIARLIGDYLDDGVINDSFGKVVKLLVVGGVIGSMLFLLTACNITLPKVETQFCYYDENGQLCVGSTRDGNVAVTGGFKKVEEK